MANILELDPFAFDAALQELGLSEEDQARLRSQYQQKNSPFSGIKQAVAPEEGRNTSDYLPVSVPEGMSLVEGITSGEWDWAIPEGFSEGITTAAEGLEAPGQILSGVPFSEQEMQTAAFKTAGTAGAGSLAFDAPEGATRMFGGMRAKKYPWDQDERLSKRIDDASLQGKDIDPDIAWEDFGVEFDDQGPVFQIDPAGAKTRTPFQAEKKLDEMLENHKHAAFDMDEVIDFPELFENYPVLRNFKVTVRSEKNGEPLRRGGWFDADTHEIVVGPDSARDPKEFRQVLLHELQHGIQAVEGTSGGASVDYFFRNNKDTGRFETDVKDLEKEVNQLNTVRDRVIDAEINYGTESETYQETWKDYVDRYRNLQEKAWRKYLTNSGEVEARAAELWDQLSSEEKRTTAPSSVKKQALGLLKKEYGDTEMPTTRLRNTYAEGGMVQGTNMDNDMTKLFAEGGLNTGDAQVDPISGNEVPPGSLPEEVRDDVDAKLSGGEYVVPADVLRFYGVSFFEKLRKKAKEGLAEMDKEGRIGGDSEGPKETEAEGGEEEEDLPFDEDELMFEEEDEVEMAEGGVVPPGGLKTFDPTQFYSGFSAFGGRTPQAATPAVPVQNTESKVYVNASGQEITIQFVDGQPTQPIPAGYTLKGSQATAPKESFADRQTTSPTAGNSRTRQNTQSSVPDWATGKDWAKMTPEQATQLAGERLQGNKMMGALGQAAGLINPLLGLAAGAAVSTRPYAEANAIEKVLRAKGNTAAADAVAQMTDQKLSEAKIGTRTLEPLLANGSGIAKRILGTPAAAPSQRSQAVSARSNATPTGNKSLGTVTPQTRESSADRQSAPKKSSPKDTTSKSGSISFSAANKGTTKKAKGGLVERRKK